MEEEKFKGRIYRIEPKENGEEGDIYIGSTINSIKQRYSHHKNHYKLYKKEKMSFCSSYEIFDKYGVDNCICKLVEEMEIETVKELKEKEREIIELCKCVNKYRPIITNEERRNNKNKKSKENKDKIRTFMKEIDAKPEIIYSTDEKLCRACNIMKPLECYRVASRRCRQCVSKQSTEKSKEYMKTYYEQNKIKIKENSKNIYNTIYKPVREKMYEAKGIPIKKRGRQQTIFNDDIIIPN